MINGEIVNGVPLKAMQRNIQENRTFDSVSTLQFSRREGQVTCNCNVILNGTHIEASPRKLRQK